MKEIFQRLMFLFHWIGFLCLVGFIGLFGLAISMKELDVLGVIGELFDELAFEVNIVSVMLWPGIAHWPIKWILTGKKSFFPWKG